MTIGIDASRANLRHKSGTEWYSYYIIRWLAKLDKENQYILYTNEPLRGGLLDLTTDQHISSGEAEEIKYDKDGFQILKSRGNNFRAKILNWPFHLFWTQGRLSLEMIAHRPDILFIPAHALPVIHPKKSIVTIHDIGYERTKHFYDAGQIGPEKSKRNQLLNLLVWIFSLGKYRANALDYLKWSTGYALKKADRIITISEYSKQDIAKFYKADESKINVIYNGYNTSIYHPINDQEKIDSVLNKYGISRPFLFYIGRIERKKNIPTLIEAFAIMRQKNPQLNHKLVLVGDASYGFDEVKYMMREFDLVNEVIMTGWVEETEIPYLYSGADAFIFPSQYEGFGIPLLQAMACEVPIAASNTTSIPEVVGDAALLFNPDFSLPIAEAMNEVLINKELRKQLVERGREKIKNFSWEKTARETLKVITYNHTN